MEPHAPLGQVQEAEGSGPQLSLEAQGCQPTCCMRSGFFGVDIASIQREVLQCQAGCEPEPPGPQLAHPLPPWLGTFISRVSVSEPEVSIAVPTSYIL